MPIAWHVVVVFTLILVAVLCLRRPLRALSGAGVAYASWLLVPLSLLAACLPSPWRSALPLAALPGVAGQAAAAPVASVAAVAPWLPWLLAPWLFGTACRVLLWLQRVRRLRRGLRPLSPQHERAWSQHLRRLQPAGRLPRPVRHALGPAVFGVLRPLLLLPADFEHRFPAARGELVLRHELVHCRRGDSLWNLLAELLLALAWWHPLAWLAWQRFRLDQELACDAVVLASQPRQCGEYGRALVDAVGGAALLAATPWPAGPQLKERLKMMTLNTCSIQRRRLGAALVGLVAAAAAVAAPLPAAAARQHGPTVAADRGATLIKGSARPVYPASAVKAKQQGSVVLRVRVGADGQAKQVRVDKAAPAQVLTDSAVAFARRARYHPAMSHGQAVASWIRYPVTYALHDTPTGSH